MNCLMRLGILQKSRNKLVKSKALVLTSSADIQNEEDNIKFVKEFRALKQKPNKVIVSCFNDHFLWADFCAYFQIEMTIFDLVNEKVSLNYNFRDENDIIPSSQKEDKNYLRQKVTGTVFQVTRFIFATHSALSYLNMR